MSGGEGTALSFKKPEVVLTLLLACFLGLLFDPGIAVLRDVAKLLPN
jgi:hypothetical protein